MAVEIIYLMNSRHERMGPGPTRATGFEARHASIVRHATYCATWSGSLF